MIQKKTGDYAAEIRKRQKRHPVSRTEKHAVSDIPVLCLRDCAPIVRSSSTINILWRALAAEVPV